MTATQASLTAECNSLDGYTETRNAQFPNGNVTKIWAELDPSRQGEYWCAAGTSYIWKHAGMMLPAIDVPYGFVSCNDGMLWAKKHGLWNTTGTYKLGDSLIYDFGNNGVPDHTETYFSQNAQNVMRTFGCNTSPPGGTGPQWNGGGCYYKARPHGPQVLGAIAFSEFLGASPAPKPTPGTRTNPFMAYAGNCQQPDGMPPGQPSNVVKFAQWAAGAPVDGRFGQQTDNFVSDFQHYHPACGGEDGIVGPKTLAVMKTIKR